MKVFHMKKTKPIICIFAAFVILLLGITQYSCAQDKKEKYKAEINKEATKKVTAKEDSNKIIKNAFGDEAAAKTKDGRIVYAGPKGGFYYLTSGGNKIYIKETDLVGAKIIGKSADGKTIFEGPRGGRYYYNSNSEKTYIKKP